MIQMDQAPLRPQSKPTELVNISLTSRQAGRCQCGAWRGGRSGGNGRASLMPQCRPGSRLVPTSSLPLWRLRMMTPRTLSDRGAGHLTLAAKQPARAGCRVVGGTTTAKEPRETFLVVRLRRRVRVRRAAGPMLQDRTNKSRAIDRDGDSRRYRAEVC